MNSEQNSYCATAWHPDLGNELVEGTLSLDRWALRFVSEKIQLEFQFQALEIDFSEMKNDILRFRHPSHPDWCLIISDLSILEHRHFQQSFVLRQKLEKGLEKEGYSWRRLLRPTLSVLAGFVAFAFLLVWLSSFTVDFLVGKVPLSYDKKLGETTFAEIRSREVMLDEPGKIAFLEKLAARLIPKNANTNFNFRFYIVADSMPNAFALPNGTIIVHSGLLDYVKSSEELAGILAHEIAHITRRHSVRKVISTTGPYVALQMFLRNENEFLALVGAGSSYLLAQNFSHSIEKDADDIGWKTLVDARVDPQGLIQYLKRMRGEMAALEDDEILAFFNSHPPTRKRVEWLESKWEKLENKPNFIPLEKLPFEQTGGDLEKFHRAIDSYSRSQK